LSAEVAELSAKAAAEGYAPSLSDAGVGALLAVAAAAGARYNVLINLKDNKDAAFAKKAREAVDAALARAQQGGERGRESYWRKAL